MNPFITYLINWCVTAVGFLWGLVTEVTSADDVFFGVKVETVASEVVAWLWGKKRSQIAESSCSEMKTMLMNKIDKWQSEQHLRQYNVKSFDYKLQIMHAVTQNYSVQIFVIGLIIEF